MTPEPPSADDPEPIVAALAADEQRRVETLNRERQRALRQRMPDQWDVARGRAKRRR